jgi:GDP-L-fucose synthase
LQVWGDGSQSRSFLYVEDFARGLLDITERYAVCDPVNVGTDEEVTISQLVHEVLEATGSNVAVEFDTTKPSGQPRRNCDNKKAKSVAGFQPQVSLKEGLRKTVEWYRNNRKKKT